MHTQTPSSNTNFRCSKNRTRWLCVYSAISACSAASSSSSSAVCFFWGRGRAGSFPSGSGLAGWRSWSSSSKPSSSSSSASNSSCNIAKNKRKCWKEIVCVCFLMVGITGGGSFYLIEISGGAKWSGQCVLDLFHVIGLLIDLIHCLVNIVNVSAKTHTLVPA